MESNQDQVIPSPADPAADSRLSPSVIGWGLAALALAIVTCTFNSSGMVLRAGFFAKCFAVIVGAALGLLGAVIGDAIRKFVQPDAVFTSGGFFQLLWVKVFWKIGPQVIGLFAGVMIGCTWVLH